MYRRFPYITFAKLNKGLVQVQHQDDHEGRQRQDDLGQPFQQSLPVQS